MKMIPSRTLRRFSDDAKNVSINGVANDVVNREISVKLGDKKLKFCHRCLNPDFRDLQLLKIKKFLRKVKNCSFFKKIFHPRSRLMQTRVFVSV